MRWRMLLIACGVLGFAEPLLGQAGGAARDPISGTWTGELGRDPTERHPLTMELKYDGSVISGTVSRPGTAKVRTGTFDQRTGALRLEIDVPEGSEISLFVFEGTLRAGTATGRVSANDETGSFVITKAGGESPAVAQPGRNPSEELRQGFDEVSGWVTRAAELVPAERYGYKPVQTVRSFGQLIAHIADSYNYYCARAAGRNVEWSDAIEQANPDKATLAQRLQRATAACNTAYGGNGGTGPLLANVSHTSLHYGNIITYMRMMGLVPPSS